MGKKKIKCHFCKCKLSLVEKSMPCRCKHVFCTKHRLPSSHECTFDFKELAKSQLQENLKEATFTKVEAF